MGLMTIFNKKTTCWSKIIPWENKKCSLHLSIQITLLLILHSFIHHISLSTSYGPGKQAGTGTISIKSYVHSLSSQVPFFLLLCFALCLSGADLCELCQKPSSSSDFLWDSVSCSLLLGDGERDQSISSPEISPFFRCTIVVVWCITAASIEGLPFHCSSL